MGNGLIIGISGINNFNGIRLICNPQSISLNWPVSCSAIQWHILYDTFCIIHYAP